MGTRIIEGITYEIFTAKDLDAFITKRKKTPTNIMLSGDPKTKGQTLLNRILFVDDVFVSDLNLEELEFRYCIFEKQMLLQNLAIDRLLLIGCQFLLNAGFDHCTVSEFVEVRDGKFHKLFEVDAGSYQDFELKQDAAEISIWSGTFNDLRIFSGLVKDNFIHIGKVFLKLSQIEGRVLCEEFICERFYMKGNIQVNGEIIIRSLFFNSFEADDLFNSGKLRLFDLTPLVIENRSPLMMLANSNFGKAEFFDCDFSNNIRVFIKNCFLVETLFVKVLWPDQLQMEERQNDHLNLLDLKETYRQLKYSYSKQGDSVFEHKFHALELDTYRTYLREKRKVITDTGWIRKWIYYRQTSIILWFSSWSSDYGQSFKRPFLTLLCTGFLLFPVMVYFGFIKALMPGLHFSFTLADISATIGHFLDFINPLRKYDTMDINAGLLLDFVMRIVASYCIYNFIRATRRFVK